MKTIEYLTKEEVRKLEKVKDLQNEMAIYCDKKFEYVLKPIQDKYQVFAKYEVKDWWKK